MISLVIFGMAVVIVALATVFVWRAWRGVRAAANRNQNALRSAVDSLSDATDHIDETTHNLQHELELMRRGAAQGRW